MGRFVAQPNVNAKEMKSLIVPVPPIDSQMRFVEAVATFKRVRSRQFESTRETNELLRSLMHKAFAGELRTLGMQKP